MTFLLLKDNYTSKCMQVDSYLKRLIVTIFIISTSFASACDYGDLLDFNLEDFENLEAKNCTQPGFLTRNAKKTCKCAIKNVSSRPKLPFDPYDRQRKQKFIEAALDKAKMGLLDISNEIATASINKGAIGKIDLKESCDITNKLITGGKGQDPVFMCKRNKGVIPQSELFLTKKMRKNLSIQLGKKFKNEIMLRNNPRFSKNPDAGLIKRQKNKNTCDNDDISDNFIADINNSMLRTQLTSFSTILSDNQASMNGATNLKEAFVKINLGLNRNYQVKKDQITEFLQSAQSNPLLTHIMEDQDIFKKLSSSGFTANSIGSIIDNAKNDPLTASKVKEKIENKCTAVFKNIQDTLCAPIDADLIPSDFKITKSLLVDMEKEDNQKKRIISSNIIAAQFCDEDGAPKERFYTDINGNKAKGSFYDKIFSQVNENLPVESKNMHKFRTVADYGHKRTNLDKANLICKFFAKPPNNEDIGAAIAKECTAETDKNPMFSPKCQFLRATQIQMKEALPQKEKMRINSLALAQAKKEGITDKKELAKRTLEIGMGLMGKMDFKKILTAHNKDQESEMKTNKILADFLGGGFDQPEKASLASANRKRSVTGGNRQEASADSSGEVDIAASGSNYGNTAIASAANSESSQTSGSAQNVYQKFASENEGFSDDQTAKRDFYNEVANRITTHKKTRNTSALKRDQAAGRVHIDPEVAKSTASLPVPYNPNYTAPESEEYYDDDSNYNIANNTSFVDENLDKAVAAQFKEEQDSNTAQGSIDNKTLATMGKNQRINNSYKRGGKGRTPAAVISKSRSGANGGSSVPSITLSGGELEGTFDQLINDALADISEGSADNKSLDEAGELKDIISALVQTPEGETKSFDIFNGKDKKAGVRVVVTVSKSGKRQIKVVNIGGAIEVGNDLNSFRSDIEKSINKIDFNKLLARLNSAIKSGTKYTEAPSRGTTYNSFVTP